MVKFLGTVVQSVLSLGSGLVLVVYTLQNGVYICRTNYTHRDDIT